MSLFAAATGIGSWPGAAPRRAAEVIVGELALPYLPELPGRGVGADLIGRAGALLVDIAIDTVPRGYRIVARPGAVMRRAASLLDEDVDALEEAWEKAGRGDRAVKVQVPGPITLAAQLELPNGHRAITDPGAVRDLAASLAEGAAVHRAAVARRLATTVVVQFDEPLLPTALAGRLAGVTAMTPVHPIDEPRAIGLLEECVAAVGGQAILHSCAAGLPWEGLRRSSIPALSIDPSTFDDRALDGLGGFIDAGRSVVLGLLPAVAPDRAPTADDVAGVAASITDRLGFSRSVLAAQIGISPSCGLAGATEEWARAVTALSQQSATLTTVQ